MADGEERMQENVIDVVVVVIIINIIVVIIAPTAHPNWDSKIPKMCRTLYEISKLVLYI